MASGGVAIHSRHWRVERFTRIRSNFYAALGVGRLVLVAVDEVVAVDVELPVLVDLRIDGRVVEPPLALAAAADVAVDDALVERGRMRLSKRSDDVELAARALLRPRVASLIGLDVQGVVPEEVKTEPLQAGVRRGVHERLGHDRPIALWNAKHLIVSGKKILLERPAEDVPYAAGFRKALHLRFRLIEALDDPMHVDRPELAMLAGCEGKDVRDALEERREDRPGPLADRADFDILRHGLVPPS
jgi:hypothetical protein